MRKIIIVLAIAIVAISCRNSIGESENEKQEDETALIFGDTGYTFPELAPSAREQPLNWSVLEDILTITKKLNGSDFQTVKNNSEQLKEYLNQYTKEIPELINTQPIQSRILVLRTQAETLYQVSHMGMINSEDIQKAVMETNIAVTNLIIHLNEKFQKDKIDLQRKENEMKELQGRKRFQDSIFELEKQDLDRKV